MNERNELTNQLLDLYEATKTGGVYLLYLDYARVYKDSADYDAYDPEIILTPEDRQDLFELDLAGLRFDGEIKDQVFYSWIGTLKNWKSHKYYRFSYPDGSGHLEVVAAPLEDLVTEDKLDNHLLEVDNEFTGDLWVNI